MKELKTISIIAPCYNEELNIDEYLDRILNTLKILNIDYKIFLIDDGSEDKTWEKILDNCKKNKNIQGIKFSRNFGHQSAIMAGIEYANSKYVFFSDVDLQDPPELLNQMFEKLINKKCNAVFGKRIKNNETFIKKYSSILFYKFFNLLSDIKISEQTSDFMLVDQKVLNELKKIKDKDIFLRGIIPWYGFNIDYVEFEREKRKIGNSGWSFEKMIHFSLTALLSFSNFPMRLSFFLSFISIIIFLILICFTIYSYFLNNVVRGWTSLFLIITFFNTIIFFVLGIMAEYVGRTYLNSKNKPLYFIDRTSMRDDT
jgi:glycosyltransferase involved in cell wall biosynthesis